MNDLLHRYLDGDLSDAEADDLLARLEQDPELAADLRAHELTLAALMDVEAPAPRDFTDRVMDCIAVAESALAGDRVENIGIDHGAPDRPTAASRGGVSRWMIAASLLLVFLLGHVTTRLFSSDDHPGSGETHSTEVAAGEPEDPGFGFVRLLYVPDELGIETISVVGDFNGWDPTSTPLRKQNGVWSTILALPPGTYEYMFVVNGERWTTDPLALRTREDGFGGRNAVLDVAS